MTHDRGRNEAAGHADDEPTLWPAEEVPGSPLPLDSPDDSPLAGSEAPDGDDEQSSDDGSDLVATGTGPGRGWGLLALWAVLLTVILPIAVICLVTLLRPHGETDEIWCLLGLAIATALALFLSRGTIRYFRPPSPPVASCANCGRELGPIPPSRCPACGEPLDADSIEKQTLFSDGAGSAAPRWVQSDPIYVTAVGLCVGVSGLCTWLARMENDRTQLALPVVCAAWFGSIFLGLMGLRRLADPVCPRSSRLFRLAFLANGILAIALTVAPFTCRQ